MQVRSTGPTVDHATYIGGSDIAALVGLSPYATALDVWAEKTRRASFKGNRRTRAGQVLEPGILALYAEEQDVDLWFPETMVTAGHTGCTPDAVSSAGYDVQVKLVGISQAMRWADVPDGCTGNEDGVPPEVLAQIHYEAWHIAELHGVRDVRGHVVAQVGTDQRVYDIGIDREFSASLIDIARRFWRDHVVTDRMPVVTEADHETLDRLYPKIADRLLKPITADVHDLARHYDVYRAAESAAKKRKGDVAAQLKALIGDGAGFVGVAVGAKVEWSEQPGKIDWEKCARTLGATDETAEAFRSGAHRVLRVTIKE